MLAPVRLVAKREQAARPLMQVLHHVEPSHRKLVKVFLNMFVAVAGPEAKGSSALLKGTSGLLQGLIGGGGRQKDNIQSSSRRTCTIAAIGPHNGAASSQALEGRGRRRQRRGEARQERAVPWWWGLGGALLRELRHDTLV